MAKMIWKSKEDILKEKKEEKRRELSAQCHKVIIDVFESNVGGITYGFSYDMEAQTNMQETYQMFQNDVIDKVVWSARKDDEKVRVTLNKRDFESLYYNGIKHKQSQISKLKDTLEPMIDSANSEEELETIKWDTKEAGEVELNINKTMDKNIQNLEISREMSDTALMEFVNMVMMGMM